MTGTVTYALVMAGGIAAGLVIPSAASLRSRRSEDEVFCRIRPSLNVLMQVAGMGHCGKICPGHSSVDVWYIRGESCECPPTVELAAQGVGATAEEL